MVVEAIAREVGLRRHEHGTQVIRLPPLSPDLNAYAARFIRSIKEECLEKMIFIGQALADQGIQPKALVDAEFAEFIRAEAGRYAKLIQDVGIPKL